MSVMTARVLLVVEVITFLVPVLEDTMHWLPPSGKLSLKLA